MVSTIPLIAVSYHQLISGDEQPEGSEEENEDEDSPDPAQVDAEKERKKAGLPPLELDSLPSTSAQKMMIL